MYFSKRLFGEFVYFSKRLSTAKVLLFIDICKNNRKKSDFSVYGVSFLRHYIPYLNCLSEFKRGGFAGFEKKNNVAAAEEKTTQFVANAKRNW